MSILSYIKTVWIDKVTTLGPTNQQKQEDGIEVNNVGLLDLDQSNKYVLLSYISAGLFAADTLIAFDDRKEILIELEATELDPTTPVKISVDNQVTEYLIKVSDELNSLLVGDGQGNKYKLHREGSIVLIPQDAPSKADEVEYDLSIQSQQIIVPVEGSPFGDNKVVGQSKLNKTKDSGFESGLFGEWATATGYAINGTNPLSGAFSLEFTGRVSAGQVKQKVLFPDGDKILVSIMLNISAYTSGQFGLQIADFNDSISLFTDFKSAATNGWIRLVGIVTAQNGGIQINLRSNTATTMTAYIDNVMSVNIQDDVNAGLTDQQIKDKYIIYFEILKSVKNPEIKVNNKNLFDGDFITSKTDVDIRNISLDEFTIKVENLANRDITNVLPNLKFKSNQQYTFSGNIIASSTLSLARLRIVYTDGTAESIAVPTTSLVAFEIVSAASKTIDYISYQSASDITITTTYTNFQIEEGISKTNYLRNENSSKKYPNQILRNVTNGTEDIEDYIDTENNILHKLTDNDFNNIIKNLTIPAGTQELATTIRFEINSTISNIEAPTNTNDIAKLFMIIAGVDFIHTSVSDLSNTDIEGCGLQNASGVVYWNIRILKSRIGAVGGETQAQLGALMDAYLAANNIEFQYQLAEEVITENIVQDGIAFAYKNMTIEIIQDNGFSNSWFAKHAQNDPETINLLGKAVKQTQKELDIYTNLKPVYQFDTDDSTTIDLSILPKGLYNIEATLKSGISSNSNISLTGYTGRSLALNNVALAITNSYIAISNSNNVVLTKSLLLVKEDQHSIVSELAATTILDADIDRYQSIKTDLLIESLPVGYTITLSRI